MNYSPPIILKTAVLFFMLPAEYLLYKEEKKKRKNSKEKEALLFLILNVAALFLGKSHSPLCELKGHFNNLNKGTILIAKATSQYPITTQATSYKSHTPLVL
jgi:hypothetical protein